MCGLIHFTSDTNFLACGYLRLWLYEDRGFYKAEFFDPPKLLFLPYPSKAETFHLWPSTSSSSLNSCDFMLQNTTRCWIRNVRKVFPRLKAGSYTRLNVETVLVGSPDFNYVAVLNIGQLKGRLILIRLIHMDMTTNLKVLPFLLREILFIPLRQNMTVVHMKVN